MKKILLVLLGVLFMMPMVAQDKKKNEEKVTFKVKGMDCQNCLKKVEKNIAFEKGVTDLECDLSNKTATVTYKKDKTDKESLVKAFDKIGMTATEQKKEEPKKE